MSWSDLLALGVVGIVLGGGTLLYKFGQLLLEADEAQRRREAIEAEGTHGSARFGTLQDALRADFVDAD